MLELWCWDENIIKRLSRHVETNEPLPMDLISKKIAIKNINQAMFTMNQIFYGNYDLIMHTASGYKDKKLYEHNPGSLFAKVR